jgi:hypothetical protein
LLGPCSGLGHSVAAFLATRSLGLAASFFHRNSKLLAVLLLSGAVAFDRTAPMAARSSSPLGSCGCLSRLVPVSRSGHARVSPRCCGLHHERAIRLPASLSRAMPPPSPPGTSPVGLLSRAGIATACILPLSRLSPMSSWICCTPFLCRTRRCRSPGTLPLGLLLALRRRLARRKHASCYLGGLGLTSDPPPRTRTPSPFSTSHVATPRHCFPARFLLFLLCSHRVRRQW